MHKILLEDIVFHAHHGWFEEEKVTGGKFVVQLELETDFSESMKSDDLDGTIDYSEVYRLIKEEMELPSKLLEHLGKRIVDRLYSSFSEIQFIRLKIEKLNPPITGEIGKVSILIEE